MDCPFPTFIRHRRLNRGKKGDTKGCANGLWCKWIKIKQRNKNFNVYVNHEHVLNVHMKRGNLSIYLKCIKDILSKRNFAYNTLEFEYLEKRVLCLFYTHCKIYWFYYFIWWCTSAVQSIGLSVVSGPGMNLASYILLQWKRLKSLKQFTKKRCWWGCGEWETLIHCSQECKPIWSLWKTV